MIGTVYLYHLSPCPYLNVICLLVVGTPCRMIEERLETLIILGSGTDFKFVPEFFAYM